jgi:hypothetical protein
MRCILSRRKLPTKHLLYFEPCWVFLLGYLVPSLQAAFALSNLTRAYRWTVSNPDARYKAFFRDSLSSYALTSGTSLAHLHAELVAGRWSPSFASKIFLPKPSGLLRTYSLLTLEDQIVYQALVNMIAESLEVPARRKLVFRNVFNHIYAGKTSRFFYVRWQRAHSLYRRAISYSINTGNNYIADFDLTAFYDSIDHNVLAHFLRARRFDPDFIAFLVKCLSTWTTTNWSVGKRFISHGHGIPQGPLASGMLSELVLQHIDARVTRTKGPYYARYVDDIRILAKDETSLRRRLVGIDLWSKEIGLFAQSSKTRIRFVTNPGSETKHLQQYVPPEDVGDKDLSKQLLTLVNKKKLTLKQLSDSDDLNVRYLLHRTKPSHRINKLIPTFLVSTPHYSSSIRTYLSRYKKLPKTLWRDVRQFILSGDHVYQTTLADVIEGVMDNSTTDAGLQSFVRRTIKDRKISGIFLQPNLKVALCRYALRHNLLTYSQLMSLLKGDKDWWTIKSILSSISVNQFGPASYGTIMNWALSNKNAETCGIAIGAIFENQVAVASPQSLPPEIINRLAVARVPGVTPVAGSAIPSVLEYTLKIAPNTFDWAGFFGANHGAMERLALSIKQAYESDIDVFIVRLDSLCDEIFKTAIFSLSLHTGGYGYGVILNSPGPLIRASLTQTLSSFKTLHGLRKKSHTAHPRDLKTGRPTKRLKHAHFYRVRKAIVSAIEEIQIAAQPGTTRQP